MPKLARMVKYLWWKANGYLGRKISPKIPQKATILITYFRPVRMKHIDPQIRNILKCQFVDRIIISNHNPQIRIEDMVKLRNERLIFLNQKSQRGSGYRWFVANEFNPEYLIVVDDDILLFPSQLQTLFKELIREPEVPHGISGMLYLDSGEFEFYENQNMQVDYLCEVYAITRECLNRYLDLERILEKNDSLSSKLESWADFMIISQTGSHHPKIHNVGQIFRSQTFNQPGVALHKSLGWHAYVLELSRSLDNLAEFDRSTTS